MVFQNIIFGTWGLPHIRAVKLINLPFLFTYTFFFLNLTGVGRKKTDCRRRIVFKEDGCRRRGNWRAPVKGPISELMERRRIFLGNIYQWYINEVLSSLVG